MIQPITLSNDQIITAPGLYAVSTERYHSGALCDGPSVSSSKLRKVFCKSPAHANAPQKDSDALILGRGAHHVILGEADFSKHFTVQPATYINEKGEEKPWHNGSKVCKLWNAANADRTILSAEQLEQIKGMAESLSRHPLVQAGILNGEVECTLAYKDAKTGLWVLARPDVIPNDSGDVADFKTCTDVSWSALERSIEDWRYDMQGSIIRTAMREVLNVEMQSFSLVWCEKTAPYCCEVSEVPLYDIDEADQDVRVALDVYAKCLETGVWPGPGGTQADAVLIPRPDWGRKRAAQRRAFLEQEIRNAAA